jgi:hypothetical protein
MSTALLQHLLEAAPAEFRERLACWAEDSCPSASILASLLEACHDGAPYADLLVEYALCNTEPHMVEERVVMLNRKWRRMWIAQGRPESFAAFDCTQMTILLKNFCTTVAFQVLKCISDRSSPRLAEVRILLPNTYLPVLGMQNLTGDLPTAVLSIADERFGAHGQAVPKEHEAIVRRVYRWRKAPYAAELLLAAAILTGEGGQQNERNAPISVLAYLSRIAALFQEVFRVHGLSSMDEFDPDVHLTSHILNSHSKYLPSMRQSHNSAYTACVEAQHRWSVAHPERRRAVQPWRLRPLKGNLDLGGARGTAVKDQGVRSQVRADIAARIYLPTLSVVVRRASAFKAIAAATAEARAHFELLGPEDHLPYDAPLQDRSAIFKFILWPAEAFVPKRGSTGKSLLITPGGCRKTVVEYVGVVDKDHQPLPDPFFVLAHRGWHDPEFRAELLRYGGVASDSRQAFTGLLRPGRSLSHRCSTEYKIARRTGQAPRILFDMQTLCTGVVYGTFILMVLYVAGLRLHEIQQIRGIPPYTKVLKSGHLQCLLYKKGRKRAKKRVTKQKLEPAIIPYWSDLRNAHIESWGGFMNVVPQNGEMLGLEPGPYLLQAASRPILQVDMGRLLRFVAFGACSDTIKENLRSLTLHILRHGHTRAREELGHSLEDIQKELGHACLWMTRYYLGNKPKEERPQVLRGVPLGSLWDALLPDAIKAVSDTP